MNDVWQPVSGTRFYSRNGEGLTQEKSAPVSPRPSKPARRFGWSPDGRRYTDRHVGAFGGCHWATRSNPMMLLARDT
jgi:hypothetical protein